jgi:hypothetical protein
MNSTTWMLKESLHSRDGEDLIVHLKDRMSQDRDRADNAHHERAISVLKSHVGRHKRIVRLDNQAEQKWIGGSWDWLVEVLGARHVRCDTGYLRVDGGF